MTDEFPDGGRALLAERVSAAVDLVCSMLDSPTITAASLPTLSNIVSAMNGDSTSPAPLHFIVTGTGSSEAHGRYLVELINRYVSLAHVSAEFRQLSFFAMSPIDEPKLKKCVLIVISQGMSANARIALQHRHLFQHCVLFTSTTTKTAPASTEKGALLQALQMDGSDIVLFPKEDEYTLLIRVMGPLAGYIAMLQFTYAMFGSAISSRFEMLSSAEVRQAWARAESTCARFVEDAPFERIKANGVQFILPHDLIPFGQNLCFKFMEGIYIPTPPMWDPMSFAHGPFQQAEGIPAANRPVRIMLLRGLGENSKASAQLLERVRKMVPDVVAIDASLRQPFSILEYELVMNRWVAAACNALGINQVVWPGKGQDGPLYLLDKPLYL